MATGSCRPRIGPRIACALTIVACATSTSFRDAHAGIQVPPIPSLPPTPSAPHLWFDGGDAAAIAALVARVTHGRTSGYFASFKGYVDARLGSLGAADDDTRSKVVKAAGLLHVLAQTPPANNAGGFTSYRDVAVSAFLGVGSRQAVDNIAELLAPPADAINILQDGSRLQSLAEGFDFLRGSGLSSAQIDGMRDILATWAEALENDWNLTGAFGVVGHRDNWGIKGGAALVTVALAVPEHAQAAGWLASGTSYLNESLDVVASPTGWFGESVWYLNYSLANLLPAAWHAKMARGVDWFSALRPFVTGSLAWRQPDGRAPPFEEGLANTFPWNALASAYPDLAPAMLWAWDQSPKQAENFENQHMHDVTRFIVADLETTAAPPEGPVTRWLGEPAHLLALRSGWGTDALQVTLIAARDYSTSELNASRHNMRNPLDLVLHGGGVLAIPTASGGPQVTSSANRSTYLSVLAKNIPLVNGDAPFIVASSNVAFGDRVDSEDAEARANHFADLGRIALTNVYGDAREVSRTVAMIDRAYVVVMDRLIATSDETFEIAWRGRGPRTARESTAARQGHSWGGVGNAGARLDIDVVGTGALTLTANASKYAPAWNQEEDIDGVLVGAHASAAAFVSVLQVGAAGTGTARSVTPVGNATVAAARVVHEGVVDTVLAGLGGAVEADGVASDALAAIVRRLDGGAGRVAGVAIVRATRLEVGGVRVTASVPTTLALTPGDDGFVAELSRDRADPIDLVLEGVPGIAADAGYEARLDGALVPIDKQGTRLALSALGTGTLVVEPAYCVRGTGEDPDADRICGRADDCPTIADPDQLDSDGDGVGDACECLGVDCDDGSVCTTDACDATTGRCVSRPIDGLACDDGSACTSGDACLGGACRGVQVSCPAAGRCQAATCDPAQGCIIVATPGAGCDDGDRCTMDDRCDASASCRGAPITCDDGAACTRDVCDAQLGCRHEALTGLACDDGDACTGGDACVDGVCDGAAITCDDDNACTRDRCETARGCVFEATAGACDDGDRCTVSDACRAGACVGDAIACDDGNACTRDACDAALGCLHEPDAEGEGCDDGNACTIDDVCAEGRCVGAGLQCDDGNPCTVDGCDGVGCASVAAAEGLGCDDGDACSDGDRCEAGACVGVVVICDDGDACTTDRCDAGVCTSEAIECPQGRVCVAGECREELAEVEEVEPGPEAIEEVEAGPEAIEEDVGVGEDVGAGEDVGVGEGEDASEVVGEDVGEDVDEGESAGAGEDGGAGDLTISEGGTQVIGRDSEGCTGGSGLSGGALLALFGGCWLRVRRPARARTRPRARGRTPRGSDRDAPRGRAAR